MRAATHAVAEALFTTDHGPPPASRLEWLADDLDDFLVHAGPRARAAYRLCILAISIIAPLLILRLPPFRSLPTVLRVRALERMERSFLSLAIFGAKTTLCVLYYEHPDAARHVGFDAGCADPTMISSNTPDPRRIGGEPQEDA